MPLKIELVVDVFNINNKITSKKFYDHPPLSLNLEPGQMSGVEITLSPFGEDFEPVTLSPFGADLEPGQRPGEIILFPTGNNFDWNFGPPIVGSLADWRAAHPKALRANINGRRDLCDADFQHLVGIKALTMIDCDQPTITDAAYAYLNGIHTLRMWGCAQTRTGIQGPAFAQMCKTIYRLDCYSCPQPEE